MNKNAQRLFAISGTLSVVALATVAYVWIGHLFGLNTSRLDPDQGTAWPMHLFFWSSIGSVATFAVGISVSDIRKK